MRTLPDHAGFMKELQETGLAHVLVDAMDDLTVVIPALEELVQVEFGGSIRVYREGPSSWDRLAVSLYAVTCSSILHPDCASTVGCVETSPGHQTHASTWYETPPPGRWRYTWTDSEEGT